MATLSPVNVGSLANDGTGDDLRSAFQKLNANDSAVNDDLVTAEASLVAVQSDITTLQADVANSLKRDGSGAVDLGGDRLSSVGAPTLAQDAVNARTIQNGGLVYILTAGTTTAYTAGFSPAITSLTRGSVLQIEIHATNTGPCTLQVNGTSALGLTDYLGRELPPGELVAGSLHEIWYDGTKFRQVREPAVEPGDIVMHAGASVRDGYLFPFGQAVSRTNYARLFAILGTDHGIGDGSTTFNLPDLRGRVIAGQDDMGGASANRLTGLTGGVDGDTFGAAGGAEIHTLSAAELPVHSHTGTTSTNGDHRHDIRGRDGGDGGTTEVHRDIDTAGVNAIVTEVASSTKFDTLLGDSLNAMQNAGSHAHTFTTSQVGSGDAHNNVQPTIILNYLIKA